jgi:hypothetical protein
MPIRKVFPLNVVQEAWKQQQLAFHQKTREPEVSLHHAFERVLVGLLNAKKGDTLSLFVGDKHVSVNT